VVDVQVIFWDSRSTRADESGDAWGAVCGACVKNKVILFLDRVSARMLCFPGMWVAVNQKLNFAAKNTRRWIKCIMWSSLLYVALITSTTVALSTTNWTRLPDHCWPKMAAANTTGMNSFIAIDN